MKVWLRSPSIERTADVFAVDDLNFRFATFIHGQLFVFHTLRVICGHDYHMAPSVSFRVVRELHGHFCGFGIFGIFNFITKVPE